MLRQVRMLPHALHMLSVLLLLEGQDFRGWLQLLQELLLLKLVQLLLVLLRHQGICWLLGIHSC
jgi:hypothetical protein